MTHKKDGHDHNLAQRKFSSEYERTNEDNTGIKPVSNDLQKDNADEELDNEELTEEDFEIDGDEEEDDV